MAPHSRRFWIAGLLLGMLPLFVLSFDMAFQRLGANPIQALHLRLGDWSLRFLCLTLAITPLQVLTQWRGMSDFRQLLGLYTFFYASLHLLVYIVLDHSLEWGMIWDDLRESAYIWFGLLTYIILFALAVTSNKAAKRRLGRRWKSLHRLIYLAAGAVLIHYFWHLKGNLAEPLFYSLVLALLLGFRALNRMKSFT